MTSIELKSIRAHDGPIEHIVAHPVRQQFATGSSAEVAVWETANTSWRRIALLVPLRTPELGPCEFLVRGIGYRNNNRFSVAYMNHGIGYVSSMIVVNRLIDIIPHRTWDATSWKSIDPPQMLQLRT